MNWLITGGCGFIGRNLIKELLLKDEKIRIRILDNFSVGKFSDLSYATSQYELIDASNLSWDEQTIQVVKGDIMDSHLAIQVSKGASVIVHLAANTGVGPSVENPRMDCTTNVIGTFNYLDACRINNIGRFVFASSGAPIGECIPPIHEEMPCHPVSPYGASKLAGEAYCSAYHKSFGVDTVALRFGNVYGPGSSHKSSVVAKFVRQALNGETLEIYGNGAQTRDFIYTEDLVKAIYKASIKKGVGGEIFQIATNNETTIAELTREIVLQFKAFGLEDIKVIYAPQRIGDVMRNFSNTSKALKLLEWKNETQLPDGLQKVIKWFLKAK